MTAVLVSSLARAQLVELIDTGQTIVRDDKGKEIIVLLLSPELAAGDRGPWREVVLAVSRHPGVVESSL